MTSRPGHSAAVVTPPARIARAPRAALLASAGIALIAGLSGALLLLGVPMPDGTGRLAAAHGLLMTLGFLGTLIALERAVALAQRWGYLSPLAAGIGGILLVIGAPTAVAAILLAMGGAMLLVIYVAFARVHPSLHGAVQAAGAVAWLAGAIVVRFGGSVSSVIPWLAAFLVLTIVGERLELSALVRPSPRAKQAFVAVASAFSIGVVTSLVLPDPGVRLAGLGLVGIAAWGARYDLARRTIRGRGVTRFIATCLLAGYVWLGVGGACWVAFGATATNSGYDASLHSVFIGFVISMVFGHAPVILPGVLRIPLPYHPLFYGHLALLHAGLLVRVVGGDLLRIDGAWQAGGILNVAAMLTFVAVSAVATTLGVASRSAAARRPRTSSTGPA